MKALQVAAGFIENGYGELLLGLRPEGKTHAGLWEFPGGKLEAGESAFEALERELREELYLDVSLVEEFGVYRFSYENSLTVDLHFFRVRALSVPKRTEAAAKIAWLAPRSILNLPLVPADVIPLKDYLARVPALSPR